MFTLSEWKPDDLIKALTLVGAAVAVIIGLLQYYKAQQWKRAEWVAQEMKALFGDAQVQAAMLMIDWGARRIPLYPDRSVLLTNEIVARALMVHEERSEGYSQLEADIRAAFDRVLDGFERFSSYVETGLVTLNDLRPYLKYWATNLCKAREASHRLTRLLQYMERYGYTDALAMLRQIAAKENARRETAGSGHS